MRLYGMKNIDTRVEIYGGLVIYISSRRYENYFVC